MHDDIEIIETRVKPRKTIMRERMRGQHKTMGYEPMLPESDESFVNLSELKKKFSNFRWNDSKLKEDAAPEVQEIPRISCRHGSEETQHLPASLKAEEPNKLPVPENPPESPPKASESRLNTEILIQNPENYTFPAKPADYRSRDSELYPRRQNSHQKYHQKNSESRRRRDSGESKSPDFRRRRNSGSSGNTGFRRRQDSGESTNFDNRRIRNSEASQNLESGRTPGSRRRHWDSGEQEISNFNSPQNFEESRKSDFRRPSQYSGFSKIEDFRRRQKSEESENFDTRRSSEDSGRRRQNLDYGISENSGFSNSRNSADASEFRGGQNVAMENFGYRGETRQKRFEVQESGKARKFDIRNSNYGIFGESGSQRWEDSEDSKFDDQKNLIQSIMSSSTNDLLMAGYSQRDALRMGECQRGIEEAKWKLEEIDRKREKMARENITAPDAPKLDKYPAHWFPNLSQCTLLPDGSLQVLGTRRGDSEDFGRLQDRDSEGFGHRQETDFHRNYHRQDPNYYQNSDYKRRQDWDSEDKHLESQDSEFTEFRRGHHWDFDDRRQSESSRQYQEYRNSESRNRQEFGSQRRQRSAQTTDSKRFHQWDSVQVSGFRRRQDSDDLQESEKFESRNCQDSKYQLRHSPGAEFLESRRRHQWDSDYSKIRRRQDSDDRRQSPGSEIRRRHSSRAESTRPRRRQSRESQISESHHRHLSSESINSRNSQHKDSEFCRTPDTSPSRSPRTSECSEDSDIQILEIIRPSQNESSNKRRHPSEQERKGAELAKKSKSLVWRPGPFYNVDQSEFEKEYDRRVKEHEEKAKWKSEREGMHAISSLCRERIHRHLRRLQNVTRCKLRVSSTRQQACYYNVEIYDAPEPEDVKKAAEILDTFSFELIRNRSEEGVGGIESFIYNIPEGVRRHLMSSRYKERRDQIKRFSGVNAIIDLEIGSRNSLDLNLPLHFEGRAEPLHEAKLAFDRLVKEIQTTLNSPIVEVQISDELVNMVLKNEGAGIKRIQGKSRTWIQLEEIQKKGRSFERVWKALIQGAPDDVEMAKNILAGELKVATWSIPKHFRSRFVGKNGANITKIRTDSGATMHLYDVDKDGYSNLEIRGREKEVKVAERMTGECLARLEEEDEKKKKAKRQ